MASGSFEKNFYLSESGETDNYDGTTAMTAADFASGKVAYLLNQGQASTVWYQNIDNKGAKDSYPVLDSTHGTVYASNPCPSEFSNTQPGEKSHDFKPDPEGNTGHICENCGEKAAHSGVVYKSDETNQDTIIASCSCGYEYGSIKVAAPSSLTYSNEEKAATVTKNLKDSLPAGVTISATEAGVTYSKVVNGQETSLNGKKPTNAGTYKASISCGSGEGKATATVTFTITQATPTVEWSDTSEKTVSYTGKTISSDKLPALTVKGVGGTAVTGYTADDFTYYYRESDSNGKFTKGLPTVCGDYEIKAKVKEKGNYTGAETTNNLKLTINKADPELKVTTTSYTKTIGDDPFTISATSNNKEVTIKYEVTASTPSEGESTAKDAVVSVDADGKVTIRGAGSATITVSQAESTNYKKAEDKTVTINVNKKSGYSVGAVTRNYKIGKETTDTLDLKTYLPKDCGKVNSYSTPTVTGDIIENSGETATAPEVTDGVLSYTVKNGATSGGSIAVTIETANYENFTITLSIALTDYDPITIAGIGFSGVSDTSAGASITVAEGSSPVSKYYLYYTDAVSGSISADDIKSNAESKTANYLSSTGSSFSLTGLKANTTYFVYAVAEDAEEKLGTLQMTSFTTKEEPKKPSGGGGSSSGGSGSGSGSGSGTGSGNGSSESSTTPTPQPAPATLLPTPAATQNPLLPESSKPTAGNPLIGNAPEDDTDDRNKAPFIKGENGKEGWEIIRTETEGTPEGSTVTVDMNGAVVVPSEVLSDIQGRDVTLVFDMGNGITWSVNGLGITGEVGDIDFGVTMGAQAGRSIPVEVINNVTGERTSLNLTLAYEGEFGFTAVLTVNMQAENAGMYANLFYYNPSTGELEFICSDLIREDGATDLTFTHASDYTIVIDSVPMDGSVKVTEDAPEADVGSTDGSTDEADGAVNTDSTATTDAEPAWNPLWIILIGAVVIVVGLGIFVIARKKQES